MKRSWLHGFLIIIFAAPGWADVITAPGAVTRVIVYRRQADVMRTVEVNLPEGGSEVRIPIPPLADEQTLRARADLESRIAGIRLERGPTSSADDSAAVSIEAALRAVELDIEQQDIVIDAAEAALAYVKNLKPSAADGSSPADVGGVEAAAALVRSQVIENREAIQRAREKIRTLSGGRDLLRQKLDAARDHSRGSGRYASLDVRRLTPGLARIVVEYAVPLAGWSPAYDARLSVVEGTMRLSFYAEVWQNSGESWDNINLLASTGRPAAGARLPDLEPAYLEPPKFADLAAGAKSRAAGMPVETKMSYLKLEKDTDLQKAAVESENGDVMATYEVKQLGQLPADGIPHRVLISEMRMPVRLSHRAVPSISDQAYLWAEGANSAGHPLPAGPAQVFVDGAYAGVARLAAVAASDTVGLSAGVDERVKITREKVKELWDARRGRRSALTRGWKIDVQNHRTKPVWVTVFDRVPVPTHDEIKIKLNLVTSGYTVDDRGILNWTIELPPAQQKTLRFEYTASVPGDWQEILGRIE